MIIKSTRIERHISQEELAKQLGFKSRISIVNIESAKQNVQLHTLVEIASFLNIPVQRLLPPVQKPKDISKKFIKHIERSLDWQPDASEKVSDFVRSITLKK